MALDAEILAELKKLNSNLSKSKGGTESVDLSDANTKTEELKRRQVLYDQILNRAKATQEISEAERDIQENLKSIEEKKFEIQKAIKAGNLAKAQSLGEELKALNEINEELEKQKDLIREANDAVKDLSDSFSNIFGGPDAVKIEDVFDPKKIAGVVGGLSKIAETGKGVELATELAAKSSEKFVGAIFKMSMQLADNEAKFMKATGANKAFARSVTNSYEEMRSFGATSEEVSATYQELFGNFTDFTMLNQQQRESLAETGVALSKLGISNADFAKSIQISTKAMGMSSEQAGQNMLNLEKFAENLGVAPQQLAADFAGAGDMLAKMGDQGTKAFKDLAIVAKTTGMQMQSIINLTNRFDTFEGAADQAGKLNAALGGNFVNAMDLMMATDPAERFGMIRDSILDAGLSFDDMSYYQKNFYKDSLGLSDVGELAALMSGDMDLVSGATQESAQSMIDAKKRAHEMATMQENLNTMLANMIPVITPLIDLMKGFTELLAENADVAKYVGYAVAGLSGSVLAYKTAIKATAFIEAALMAPRKAMAGITRLLALAKGKEVLATNAGTAADTASIGPKLSAAGATRTAGAAAKASVPHILALGAAALMIGRAIGIAAVGVSELALAFKDLGVNAIGASVGIALLMVPFLALMALGYAMIAGPQAAVTAGVVGFFLALGAAAFLLGAGIGLAAYGMSFLVEAFAALDPVQILALSAAMIAFSAAMNMLAVAGVAAMFGAPGLIVLTAAIVGMAYGLSLIEELITNVANAFVSFFDTIANPNTASNIKEIAKAIEAIPIRKNIEFATSMAALAAANTAAGALGTTQAVTKAITGGNNQNNITSAATPYEVTINVMLDRDKLATVVEQINGQQAKKAIQGIQ